jgi:hypothetical protein
MFLLYMDCGFFLSKEVNKVKKFLFRMRNPLQADVAVADRMRWLAYVRVDKGKGMSQDEILVSGSLTRKWLKLKKAGDFQKQNIAPSIRRPRSAVASQSVRMSESMNEVWGSPSCVNDYPPNPSFLQFGV